MPSSLIESSSHIVLVAHINPDADSMGAACAFYSYLLRSQKKLTLFCASNDIDQRLAFLPWFEKLTQRFPDDADCVICFDCGSYSRLGIDTTLPLINIDHHESNDRYGTHAIIDISAISTTQVVYEYFVANSVKINGKIATALYAGLLDDSKCFSLGKCDAKTFAMAYHLIQSGADHAMCTDWLYRRRSLALLRMKGRLLSQMKLLGDGRVALFEVTLGLLEETGATLIECKQILDEALEMRFIQAALMIIEHPKGGSKISLRTDGEVNAANILKEFGGGGHATRSGARHKQNSDSELINNLITMITKELV